MGNSSFSFSEIRVHFRQQKNINQKFTYEKIKELIKQQKIISLQVFFVLKL